MSADIDDEIVEIVASEMLQSRKPPAYSPRSTNSGRRTKADMEAIRNAIRAVPTYVLHFGDHDPSGVWIAKKTELGLRRHAPRAEIHFKRVAVTPEQIKKWNLPTSLNFSYATSLAR